MFRKHMKKLNFLAVLIMILSSFAVTAHAAGHTHCVCCSTSYCGSGHSTSRNWTATSTLPTSAGYYYLTSDVTITETWTPVNGTYLCLNGHDIIVSDTSSNVSAVTVTAGITVSISDCSTATTAGYIDAETGLWKEGTGDADETVYNLTGGVITGGTSTGGGGGAFSIKGSITNDVVNYAKVSLYQVDVAGNTAPSFGAGAYLTTGGSLFMKGCSFVGNVCDSEGGAIRMTDNSELTANNCTFAHNTSDYGGAMNIYWESLVTIQDCAFHDNQALGGGAILSSDMFGGNSISIQNTSFTDNTASSSGGAISQGDPGTMTLSGCNFTGNTAGFAGGAIASGSECTLTASDCTFTGNSADEQGGAVRGSGNTMTFTGCTMDGNEINEHGFTDPLCGGGLYIGEGSSCTLTNTTVNDNDLIFALSTSSTVTQGTAIIYGGGIYCNGTLTMTGGSVNGNYGTLYYDDDQTYTAMGGGIYLGANGTMTLTNTKVNNNVMVNGGYPSFYYAYNDAHGGGIYMASGATATIIDSEITGNSMSATNYSKTRTSAGGVYVADSGALTLGGKMIIRDNKAGEYAKEVISNIYLPKSVLLEISTANKLLSGSAIWVTSAVASTDEAPVDVTAAASTNYASYFRSDENYDVISSGSSPSYVVQLAGPHEHSLTINQWFWNESELTASAELKCTSCDYTEEQPANVRVSSSLSATCTSAGYTRYQLYMTEPINVSTLREVSIPATGHSYGDWVETTPATCTETGVETQTCGNCGGTVTQDIPMLGHDFSEWAITEEPDCMNPGEQSRSCSRCSEVETDKVDALGHSFTNYISNGDATCTLDGTKTATCDRCTETDTIADTDSAMGHSFTKYESNNNATCTDNCTETATCDRCTVTHTQEIADSALGHQWSQWITMYPATCVANGEQRRDCSVCDEFETQTITDGTHSYGAWGVTKEATCTEEGIKEQQCRYCNDTKSDVIKPTGHTMGEWVVEKSASCTVEGIETAYCDNCDHQVSQSIAAIGHDYVAEITDPDCVNGGYTTYTCDNCGDIYTDNATDPIGHDYASEVTPPDCENSGYTTYTCKSCGHSFVGDEVKALAHNYESVVTAPDCENGGYTTHTCSRCDDSYTDSETKALGHKWDKGVVTVEPGEYTSGTKEYTCELCGEIKTEVLGALGHTHVYSSVVTPATCTTDGYTTYTCNCGNSYNDDYVTASGHKYGSWYIYTAATCTKVGEKRSDCANCDAYQSDTIAVIAHSFSKYVSDNNATCTKDGTKTATCDNCSLTDTVTDDGTKLGHSWGAWEETKAATSAAEGEEMRSCDRCGDSEFKAVPKLTHPFVDVPAGKFYEVPVIWAVNNDITNGIDETHFAPDNICNRGQVVTFLWRAAGSPEPTSSYNPFTDVKEGKFYYKAVLWAVEEGITKGTSATTFSPNDNCTRGHVATFLWRTLGEPKASSGANPFTDVAQGRFYYDAVLWAAETGVTTGMTATTFEPNTACTRGQIVTFLYRALG